MEIRADRSTLGRMTTTPEGYIRGESVVTRTGVFDYINPDGTIRRELRHPDDVFSTASLATLSMIPVTVDHPSELLTLETATELAVGQTGENSRVDGKLIYTPFTITHKRGIDAVSRGKLELSLGYKCDLLEEKGVYNGEEYTHRQTNIIYNHLSIVDRARAGSAARINLDGAAVQSTTAKEVNTMSEKTMAAVNLDGITYDAAPEVAKALTKAQSELETARNDAAKTKADMQKEYDGLKAQMDALKEEMDKLKDEKSDEAISAKVQERLSLERAASKLDTEAKFDGLSDQEVMVAAIQSVRPTFDAEGKSADYVKAAFDMAIESAGDPDAIAKQRQAATTKVDSQGEKDYRADAADAIKNQWKKGAE
jgi:hypothetical protein